MGQEFLGIQYTLEGIFRRKKYKVRVSFLQDPEQRYHEPTDVYLVFDILSRAKSASTVPALLHPLYDNRVARVKSAGS